MAVGSRRYLDNNGFCGDGLNFPAIILTYDIRNWLAGSIAIASASFGIFISICIGPAVPAVTQKIAPYRRCFFDRHYISYNDRNTSDRE